jgi:hypothetical protein
MAIQHPGLRGNARARADSNQVLELGEHLFDILNLRTEIGVPRGGPAGNDQHVNGRVVGVGVGRVNRREEGRVESVHGGAEWRCGDGVEGASQEGELKVGLAREGLEDLQGPEDVEHGKGGREEKAEVARPGLGRVGGGVLLAMLASLL